jgi:protocatechuate 3,4-dioxygenase alpha subunit
VTAGPRDVPASGPTPAPGPTPVPGLTPAQTVGPFFAHALPWQDGPFVVPEGVAGAFWIRGRVLDGDGEPVPDAMVETWQADPDGRFDHPDDPRGIASDRSDWFRGFGRCPTDPDGRYRIHTVKPGPVPGANGGDQAPHVDLSIFARGLLDRVVTRLYFPDETAANAADPVLAALAEPVRPTLVAGIAGDGYTFDIRLQGEHETAFFAV